MLKIFLDSIFSEAMVGLMYSLTGGEFCFFCDAACCEADKKCSYMGSEHIRSVPIISGIITGTFIGLTANLIVKHINGK